MELPVWNWDGTAQPSNTEAAMGIGGFIQLAYKCLLIFQKFTEIFVSGTDTLWTTTVLSQ